jgi:hypothetical protein
MSVDKMPVDEMFVDKLSVYKMAVDWTFMKDISEVNRRHDVFK